MELETKFSPKRVIYLICIFFSAIATDIILINMTRKEVYDLIGLIAGTVILVLLGFAWIEYNRITHKYSDEKYSNFRRIFICFISSCLILVLCGLLGLRVVPFSIISAGFSLITEPTTGVIFGTYFSLLFNMTYTGDYRYFILYMILVVAGAALARLFTDRDTVAGGGLILLCTYALGVSVTTFTVDQKLGVLPVVYAMAYGIVAVLFTFLMGWFVVKKVDNSQQIRILKLLEPETKIHAAWREFSPKQYKYCYKVSELAYEAAGYIGADAALAKAGGLFSRIGLMSGENLAQTNIEVGEHYNFPTNLIQVIYEASDRKNVPTMKESAIVVMADRCMRAFVKMESDDAKIGWNREIVLQQLFNNATTEGLLDECGLSMKEYLAVKDSFSRKLGEV